ncbi:MAG: undecaprenyl/decaprenyl-phosphate alpha-N-acetylglucosaminyl 1-phosphate transferase [Eggerthellaceae bacterium]|nr:undecaprenyl/decaprenyl-phosphate alpha-N-acetylglucosaminyl 1-phosphate transferase [Eggerthellaceae bacterium]
MIDIFQASIVFVVAALATYLMVPASKRIAKVIGAVDYPDDRRVNSKVVPRCGGIALYVGLLAGFAALGAGIQFFGWDIADIKELGGINLAVLFAGITLMFAVGLLDDVTQLSPLVKFGGQILAAVVVVLSGVSIELVRSPFGTGFIELAWLDYPLTVLYLVVFVNITNLIDGLDGLAAGIVAIVACGLLFLVLMRGGTLFAFCCIALIAVCVAFLRFNFTPASIFMGDSGSLLLGLMVGIVSISGVVRTQSLVVMLVPLVMAGIPLLDTLSAIVRRVREGQPIQQADLGHIHHRLMGAGWGQRKSVLILYLCSAVLAVAGCLLGSLTSILWEWVVIVLLAVVLSLMIWRFGLFSPVLKHYYDNKGGRGPRKPPSNPEA